MKLYELTNDYQQLLAMLDEENDFPPEAIADTLESITAEIEDKADNIACMLKSASVKIDDDVFFDWAEANGKDLLTYAQPKANLTAIKKAIGDGEIIPGAQIEEKQNIQIK